MKAKQKATTAQKRFATSAARYLFTSGAKKRAIALRLFSTSNIYLGERCEEVVADELLRRLKRYENQKGTKR